MSPHVQFMHSPRGSWSRAAGAIRRADGGMFWWAVGITFLLGMATFSWIFCIYVFSHPEKPFNYGLLAKFHKLDPIRQFSEKDVPSGRTCQYDAMYEMFYAFSDENLAQKNSDLQRGYLTNYRDERPVFIKGRFKVIHARPLGKDDIFPCGAVARAVAINDHDRDYRNVMIEYVLPTAQPAGAMFAAGDIIEIDTAAQRRRKRRTFTSVLNIGRPGDDNLLFTVVPLTYGEFAVEGEKTIVAAPPAQLNLKARWPITDDAVGTPETVRVAAAVPGK